MSKVGITVILLITFLSIFKSVHADAECKAFLQSMMDDLVKIVVPCIDKFGANTREKKKEHIYCILRCIMIEAKFLGTDGALDHELLIKMFDRLPESVKQKLEPVIAECGVYAAQIDPSEPSCRTYEPMLECILGIAVKLCD